MAHIKSKQTNKKLKKKMQTKYPKSDRLKELLVCASLCMQVLFSSSGSEYFKNLTTFEII